MRKLTDCICEERSLMRFLKVFLAQRETQDDIDEDEDCHDESSDDGDICENLNQELQA